MPRPNWTHTCTKTGRTRNDWKPFRCWRCFGQAEFSGWSHSVVEMMGDYQRVYGLKCIGPHRPLADQVFAGAFLTCATCGGSGYHDDLAHRRSGVCADCDGLGRRPTVSQEDMERRRATVLAAFPDAAIPQPRRVLPGAPAVTAARNAGSPPAPAPSGPMTPARGRAAISAERPDAWELFRVILFVLVLAPGWLFGSMWALRGGQLLVGTVLLFASAFAALSGLIMASPSSFDRGWLWVWGAAGAGLLLLLGVAGVQAVLLG
jgi:hypothetical protein